MSTPRTRATAPARLRYFDPRTETDPLVLRHISLPPVGTPKNDPRVTGTSGHPYPVWAVYLNYVSADRDMALTLENYGGDLTSGGKSGINGGESGKIGAG